MQQYFSQTSAMAAQSAAEKADPPLSLGDILNVMDGLLENSGAITFLTANNIDQLHEAIMRPGRIDLKLKYDRATCHCFKQILLSVYREDEEQARIRAISDTDPRFDRKWTPADIQETCFQNTLRETLEYFENLL